MQLERMGSFHCRSMLIGPHLFFLAQFAVKLDFLLWRCLSRKV
uniref:Uncharacterized protein n=1 Tax=Rhizophora mucronata TaxID=61149 RepID=A0A2P2NYV0_RHIMU